jgi:hypothetical protein
MNVNCEFKLQIAISLCTSKSYRLRTHRKVYVCCHHLKVIVISANMALQNNVCGKKHNRNTTHSPASSFTSYFLVKIFIESKGSFSYSQKHATRPCSKPDESSSHLHCLFPWNTSQLSANLSGHARFPSILAAKNSVTPCPSFPFRATCPKHITLHEFTIVIISSPTC